MKGIEATAELFRIFAQDDSEKADVDAINILKGFFSADAAALFYMSGRREYRLCLAGADIPIRLPKERWEECVGRVGGGSAVAKFGPWAMPGSGESMGSWMGSELLSGSLGVGYLLLGLSSGEWTEECWKTLSSVSATIAPIVAARIERQRAEFVRMRVEETLATSEKRLRSFFDDSRDMIYTANADDVVTSVNAAGLLLLGRERHEIIGHSFSYLALNPQDRESLFHRVAEAGYATDFEIVLAKKDKSAVFCLETVHAIKGPRGEIVELQGIIKDISERIKDERELWKTNMELADANMKLQQTQSIMVQQEKLASIGQLAAGVAHEINNPLGFLKSNYAMLEKDVDIVRKAWEELRNSGGEVVEAVAGRSELVDAFADFDQLFSESAEGLARIMRIVSNLKTFSRIDQGSELELFDVNAGIESTLVVASNELKYVAETQKILGEIPRIRARGGEINQVVLNLLVNAAQAIEAQNRPERGVIRIETKLKNDRVLILVSDNGPGIPEALRLRIFDPFFTTKEPGKGTGLGLSISYDIIVAKHGGSLSVKSEPGKGTTFAIELPVAGPSAALAAPASL